MSIPHYNRVQKRIIKELEEARDSEQFTGKIERNWWVTSYSALSRFHSAPTQEDKQTKKIVKKSSFE